MNADDLVDDWCRRSTSTGTNVSRPFRVSVREISSGRDSPHSLGQVALHGQGIGRRTEAQKIEDRGLVIAASPIRGKSALRRPSMCDRGLPVLSPLPVGSAVERFCQFAKLTLLGHIPIEVQGGGQCPCEQEGRVDGGQFTLPGTPSAVHVEEVIVEPLVAGGVRLGPCGLLQKNRKVANVRATASVRVISARSTEG